MQKQFRHVSRSIIILKENSDVIEKISHKIGISPNLFFGYIGLIFFMLGAGIETSWFSAFLVSLGYEVQLVSLIFSFYGLFVAIFSWMTSFFTSIFTIRKVMALGLAVYLITTVILVIGLMLNYLPLIAISYIFRGASYPLFAYAFLVWVTLKTDLSQLGKATSWFWFSFNLGMTILSPIFASVLLNIITPIFIIGFGALMALIGGFLALKLNGDQLERNINHKGILNEMKSGLTIYLEYPRLLIGLIVKSINNVGQFGFVIMMPIFLIENNYSLTQWSSIWAITYIINTFALILFGNLGDRFGWRRIVSYFSGTLSALSCVLIAIVVYFFPGNFFLLMIAFAIFSFGIAAFGPLSALIPAMAPEKKTVSISVLNLGSGLSNFLGPLLVTILFQNYGGYIVLLIFAGLYLLSSILTIFLKLPEEIKTH